jgi:hypothetical protein
VIVRLIGADSEVSEYAVESEHGRYRIALRQDGSLPGRYPRVAFHDEESLVRALDAIEAAQRYHRALARCKRVPPRQREE